MQTLDYAGMKKPPARQTGFSPDASGTYMRAYRKKAKLTQEELGAKIGVSQGMISHWENGTETLDLDDIRRIAAACGTTPKSLMYRHPDIPESIEDIYDDLPDEVQAHMIEIAKSLRRTSGA